MIRSVLITELLCRRASVKHPRRRILYVSHQHHLVGGKAQLCLFVLEILQSKKVPVSRREIFVGLTADGTYRKPPHVVYREEIRCSAGPLGERTRRSVIVCVGARNRRVKYGAMGSVVGTPNVYLSVCVCVCFRSGGRRTLL